MEVELVGKAMKTLEKDQDDLTVMKCWACDGGRDGRNRCTKCSGVGSIFWVNGRTYPYTPRGEKVARTAADTMK